MADSRDAALGRQESPFLEARWENLVLLNYDCPAGLLEPFVPRGTELDVWQGSPVLSLVGFHFVETRVLGIPAPGYRAFEEVNLRFYVRRHARDGMRRAVVFIKELVPRRVVAAVARWVYNEPYTAVPMSHRARLDPAHGGSVEYAWIHAGRRHRISASADGPARDLEAGSEAEFMTEHYWGYGRRRDGGTLEYRVEHPRWRVWAGARGRYERPHGSEPYGAELGAVLRREARSCFVAVGSEVSVFRGRRLKGDE